AVGSGASALYQEALFATVANDIPHDKEVAFQFETFNQCKFALDLAMRTFAEIPIAPSIAVTLSLSSTLSQEGHHRLSLRNRVARKFISEILQRELQAR